MKYFKLNNEIINVGDWDYQIHEGVEKNPLPNGAIELEGDLVKDEKGRYREPDDYKNLRDYPDIGDQLDCLWHAMDKDLLPKIEPMYSEIKSVKEKHPKQ